MRQSNLSWHTQGVCVCVQVLIITNKQYYSVKHYQ